MIVNNSLFIATSVGILSQVVSAADCIGGSISSGVRNNIGNIWALRESICGQGGGGCSSSNTKCWVQNRARQFVVRSRGSSLSHCWDATENIINQCILGSGRQGGVWDYDGQLYYVWAPSTYKWGQPLKRDLSSIGSRSHNVDNSTGQFEVENQEYFKKHNATLEAELTAKSQKQAHKAEKRQQCSWSSSDQFTRARGGLWMKAPQNVNQIDCRNAGCALSMTKSVSTTHSLSVGFGLSNDWLNRFVAGAQLSAGYSWSITKESGVGQECSYSNGGRHTMCWNQRMIWYEGFKLTERFYNCNGGGTLQDQTAEFIHGDYAAEDGWHSCDNCAWK